MFSTRIDLDDYEIDRDNCIYIDLDDYDYEIKDYVREEYKLDLNEIDSINSYKESLGNSNVISFKYNNLADEFLFKEIIERYNLNRFIYTIPD